MSLLLAAVAVPVFAAVGAVRDGVLEYGSTFITRVASIPLIALGAALAFQRMEALVVAAAFAPGVWWAPWHGRSIRFGEGQVFDWRQFLAALANAAILLALPAAAL